MGERQELTPEAWWSTDIIDMSPGTIRFRGYPIQDLIGRVGFAEMVWLMTRGELPDPRAAALLEAALVAGVDHGPQAPSIAIARMAMTCGVGINNAMASAINVLGDVHGGAGEQCVAMYLSIARRADAGAPIAEAVADEIAAQRAAARSGRVSALVRGAHWRTLHRCGDEGACGDRLSLESNATKRRKFFGQRFGLRLSGRRRVVRVDAHRLRPLQQSG